MPRTRIIPRGRYRITLRGPKLPARPDAAGVRIAKAPPEIHTWAQYFPGSSREGPDAGGFEVSLTGGRWIVRRVNVRGVTSKWTLIHDDVEAGIAGIVPSRIGRGRSHVEIFTVFKE